MLEPFFLDGAGGRISCVLFRAPRPVEDRRVLLFVPPWAEELNKSRRMMGRLGHALAEDAGVSMLVPDLYGTGDSAGQFRDARWETWLANVTDAAGWLDAQGFGSLCVGGLRTGALLGLEALSRISRVPTAWLLWHPVVGGQQLVQQFLRLRLAASMSREGERETTKGLRERLAQGEILEVGGYELSHELVAALEARNLRGLVPPAGVPGLWLDVTGAPREEPMPAVARVLESWRERGVEVQHRHVVGDAFWSTQELADVPAIVTESVQWLRGAGS